MICHGKMKRKIVLRDLYNREHINIILTINDTALVKTELVQIAGEKVEASREIKLSIHVDLLLNLLPRSVS